MPWWIQTQMPLGSTRVALRPLLRQSRRAVQFLAEYPLAGALPVACTHRLRIIRNYRLCVSSKMCTFTFVGPGKCLRCGCTLLSPCSSGMRALDTCRMPARAYMYLHIHWGPQALSPPTHAYAQTLNLDLRHPFLLVPPLIRSFSLSSTSLAPDPLAEPFLTGPVSGPEGTRLPTDTPVAQKVQEKQTSPINAPSLIVRMFNFGARHMSDWHEAHGEGPGGVHVQAVQPMISSVMSNTQHLASSLDRKVLLVLQCLTVS